jgi:hypothetical protein
VAWLQCGEQLNRKPLHATLQPLGPACRAGAIVIQAAQKTSIKVTAFSEKFFASVILDNFIPAVARCGGFLFRTCSRILEAVQRYFD